MYAGYSTNGNGFYRNRICIQAGAPAAGSGPKWASLYRMKPTIRAMPISIGSGSNRLIGILKLQDHEKYTIGAGIGWMCLQHPRTTKENRGGGSGRTIAQGHGGCRFVMLDKLTAAKLSYGHSSGH